jgi:hypothetical protein
LEESGDEEARGGRERERKREPARNPHIPAGSLFVFRLEIWLSVGFGRIRPDLSNPPTHIDVGLTVSAGSVKPTHVHRRRFDRSFPDGFIKTVCKFTDGFIKSTVKL